MTDFVWMPCAHCGGGLFECACCGTHQPGARRPVWAGPKPAASDPVNHPAHYAHPSGVECIEIVRHLNYNRGTAIAYIWRADAKDNTVQDLEKAIWHLQDEVAMLRGGQK